MATGENELAQMSCEDFGEFKVTTEVLWYNVEESSYFVKSFTCSVESIIGRSISCIYIVHKHKLNKLQVSIAINSSYSLKTRNLSTVVSQVIR